MTNEDKELLIKDICARLPYGVKVAIEWSKGKYTEAYDLKEINNDSTSEVRRRVTIWNYGDCRSVVTYPIIVCRPYLRPMDSMTVEEYNHVYNEHINFWDKADYCNKHYLDYHDLIHKGLALPALEEMYNLKN